MVLNENYELENGIKIPKIGLGTWLIDNDKVAEVVRNAIKLGYRHIDTAEGYDNEEGVGIGIATCGIDRKDLFITTKLDASAKDERTAREFLESSFDKLKLDYIDMVIIHSPDTWQEFREENNNYYKENIEIWKVLEKYYKAGKIKVIGVSNFEIDDIQNLIDNCEIKPMVNQILAHISNTPKNLIKYCQDNNILVEAYSPIAHGEILNNEKIKSIAEKYKVSVAQICIRYCLQLGLLPLPKSSNPEHIKTNAEVDFVISDEDMSILENMEVIKNYGEASIFPVFGGKADENFNFTPRDFIERK